MVSVGYLIDKPEPPSALKSFANRRVIPPAIDAAGSVESAVYELSEYVRARPGKGLLAAGALGLIAGALLSRRSRARRFLYTSSTLWD